MVRDSLEEHGLGRAAGPSVPRVLGEAPPNLGEAEVMDEGRH